MVWSRSRKRADSGLERMELDLGLRLGQNGAQSRPAVVLFFSFLFLLLGCGFDNDLIMVGLWLWLVVVVDYGRGGGVSCGF